MDAPALLDQVDDVSEASAGHHGSGSRFGDVRGAPEVPAAGLFLPGLLKDS